MLLQGGGTPLEWSVQFGTHGFPIHVTQESLDYLQELELAPPVSEVFWPEGMSRWKTLNDVLKLRYRPLPGLPERLRFDAPGVAALIGFPLLEEISRRVSQAWDEDGVLNIDVPESMGLWRLTSEGKREPKTLKKGKRIVDLSHKLFVMKTFLDINLRQTIENLDSALSTSPIAGSEVPHVTFFERLELFRNLWSHGRRLEGNEAWLVTLFIAMLYFWLPQSENDRQLADSWAKAGLHGNLPYLT
jgi:hypothetical protein